MSVETPLPDGWAWSTLGELGHEVRERKNHFGNENFQLWSIPAFISGQPENVMGANIGSSKTIVEPNDVLVSKINPRINRVWRVGDRPSETSQLASPEWLAFRCYPELGKYFPRYLTLYLSSPKFRSWIKQATSGVTGSHTRAKAAQILQQLVPVPPLAEQHRIVEAIEDHLSRLNAAESLSRNSALRAGKLAERLTLFTELAGPLNAAAQAPTRAETDDVDLPELPATWQWKRLEEIADVVGGITKDSKKQANPELEEIPYLRVANVQSGHIMLDVVTKIRATEKQIEKLLLCPGDVLLNEGGDRDKLGRGWVWRGEIPRCIHQNHVFRIRIKKDQLKPELLAWHANSYGRKWFERNGKQSVNLASVSLSVMKKFPVPVPPMAEQAALVELVANRTESVTRVKTQVDRVMHRNAQLRQQLLHSAFAGILVDQDPADEPASVLLERIASERVSKAPARHRLAKSGATT